MSRPKIYSKRFAKRSDLLQGDIVEVTEDFRNAFPEDIHGISAPDRNAFVVVTHSCDLARRLIRKKKRCKATHIALSPVSPLLQTLPELLDSACEKIGDGVYSARDKGKAKELLERVFGQNEEKRGLFYLPEDLNSGISEESVAFLRDASVLKANDANYRALLKFRKGRLTPEFRNKLGWLVGNLYSRAGTQDWDPDELRRHVKSKLKSPQFTWIDYRIIRVVKEKELPLDNMSAKDLIDTLNANKGPDFKEELANEAASTLKDLLEEKADEISEAGAGGASVDAILKDLSETLAKRLRNAPNFRKAKDPLDFL